MRSRIGTPGRKSSGPPSGGVATVGTPPEGPAGHTRTRLRPGSAREPVSPATVFSPYRRLFTVPGAGRFSLAGWLARLPASTTGLGTVLLVSSRSGSYALAGGVSGAFAIAFAAGSPVWSPGLGPHGGGRG